MMARGTGNCHGGSSAPWPPRRRQVHAKALALIRSEQRADLEREAKESAGWALREKDRMLATLMGNLPGMVYRYRTADDRSIAFVSEGSRVLLGYAPGGSVRRRSG